MNGLAKTTAFLAALLLGFTAAGLLGAWAWWLDLLSHFRPHIAMAALVLLAVGAVLRHRSTILRAGLSLALVVPGMVPLWWGEPASGGAPLTVQVINVNRTTGDPTRVAAQIRAADADIVGLIEVDARWMRALEPTIGPWPHRVVRLRDDNFGIALLSRLPLSKARVATRASSPVAQGVVEVGGRRVGLLLVHPPPPVSGRVAAIRDADLGHYVALRARLPTDVVVMGDFNATPWSAPFRALLDQAALREARDIAGAGIAATWPTFLPGWLGIPIDHVLVGGAVGVEAVTVGGQNGSDHRPVLVRLRIPAL